MWESFSKRRSRDRDNQPAKSPPGTPLVKEPPITTVTKEAPSTRGPFSPSPTTGKEIPSSSSLKGDSRSTVAAETHVKPAQPHIFIIDSEDSEDSEEPERPLAKFHRLDLRQREKEMLQRFEEGREKLRKLEIELRQREEELRKLEFELRQRHLQLRGSEPAPRESHSQPQLQLELTRRLEEELRQQKKREQTLRQVHLQEQRQREAKLQQLEEGLRQRDELLRRTMDSMRRQQTEQQEKALKERALYDSRLEELKQLHKMDQDSLRHTMDSMRRQQTEQQTEQHEKALKERALYDSRLEELKQQERLRKLDQDSQRNHDIAALKELHSQELSALRLEYSELFNTTQWQRNSFHPNTIRRINNATGLRMSFYTILKDQHISHTHSPTIAPRQRSRPDTNQLLPKLEWCLIPKGLTDEIASLSWEQVMGQGVLVQYDRCRLALLSIAQAAVVQLDDLVDLLECIIWAIDDSINTISSGKRRRFYQLSWVHAGKTPATASVGCVRLAGDNWAIGFESVGEPRMHLLENTALIMDWLRGVFSATADDRSLTLLKDLSTGERVVATMTVEDEIVESGAQSLIVKQPSPATSEPYKHGQGCWRRKIRGGTILQGSYPSYTISSEDLRSDPIKTPVDSFKDGLVLTAGALWALFDNDLQGMPGCNCTLRTTEGEYLSCMGERENWFIWHLDRDESKVCGGRLCSTRVDTTFAAQELQARTPCILGWPASLRKSAKQPIAEKLALSERFAGNPAVTCQIESFQIQGQVGLSAPATVNATASASFKLNRYSVVNSMASELTVALARLEQSTILVYCEERKVHLAVHGADIIELICVQLCKEVCQEMESDDDELEGICDQGSTSRPKFQHNTAIGRMRTWRNSVFISKTGHEISGEFLVREASNRISRLLDIAKSYEKGPLYWSLGALIAGGKCTGLKAPIQLSQTGWYLLWKQYPLLILAVGKLDDDLVSDPPELVQWSAGKPTPTYSMFRFNRRSSIKHSCHPPITGGLLAENNLLHSLLRQASLFYPAKIAFSERLLPGYPGHQPSFSIVLKKTLKEIEDPVKCSTCDWCSAVLLKHCLHHFH